MSIMLTLVMLLAGSNLQSTESRPATHIPLAAHHNESRPPEQIVTQTAGLRITGTVTDVYGGAMPGVTVVATSAPSAAPHQTTTNNRGEYVIADLGSDQYELVFTLMGMKTARQRVRLQGQDTVVPNVRLEMETVREVVIPSEIRHRSDLVFARTITASDLASELLDEAKAHFEQGRYAEAEAKTAQALEMIRMVGRRSSAIAADPVLNPAYDTTPAVRVRGNIREPKMIKHVEPAYPEVARQAKIEGYVIIQLIIKKDGTIADAKVLGGQHVFLEAALAAVKQWQYTPTTLDGVPVEVIMNVTVHFRLK